MPNKKVRFDDFELDYGGFQLCRGGRPVPLEGLPLQLLLFIADRKGDVVTREEIERELWSEDAFIEIETGINTAIRKIRLALGDNAEEPRYLQTIVGRGYRFVAPNAEDVGSPETFSFSAEELGKAIRTAAGLDDLKATRDSVSDFPTRPRPGIDPITD
jgi:DNA-binding winged helix-turn-helix (wHTH) protein